MHHFCQIVSGDDAIWNHLVSWSTDLVNILKEKKRVVPVFFCLFCIYPKREMDRRPSVYFVYIPKKICFCYFVSDLKASKLSYGCSFNFLRMYKHALLGLLSHTVFWVWPHCCQVVWLQVPTTAFWEPARYLPSREAPGRGCSESVSRLAASADSVAWCSRLRSSEYAASSFSCWGGRESVHGWGLEHDKPWQTDSEIRGVSFVLWSKTSLDSIQTGWLLLSWCQCIIDHRKKVST